MNVAIQVVDPRIAGAAGVPSVPAGQAREAAETSADITDATNAEVVLLNNTEDVFNVARQASGVGATLFAHIEEHGLHRRFRYDTMRDYASKELGVSSPSTFKKLRRAGQAVRKYLPDLYQAVVEQASAGRDGHARVHQRVPDVTTLSLLGGVLNVTPQADRAGLIGRVVSGDISTRELEQLRKQALKPAKPVSSKGYSAEPAHSSQAEPDTPASSLAATDHAASLNDTADTLSTIPQWACDLIAAVECLPRIRRSGAIEALKRITDDIRNSG